MPKRKGVRVQIVVEDEALERFSRETLLKFGFNRREIRVTGYPVGRGSAKDWVDRQYSIEVQALRAKSYQNLGIVVGTDADNLTVNQRAKRLADALQNARVEARRSGERIVLWIPKWSIETWILYFAHDARDEHHDYKHDVKKPDYRATAQAFIDQYRKYRVDNDLETQPSLRASYDETKRLDE
jgi:hypothetical protein